MLNAANEVAVAGFLGGQAGFLQIAQIVQRTLEQADICAADSLDCVLDADRQAREIASQWLARMS